jgi:hypothetical protein
MQLLLQYTPPDPIQPELSWNLGRLDLHQIQLTSEQASVVLDFPTPAALEDFCLDLVSCIRGWRTDLAYPVPINPDEVAPWDSSASHENNF